MILMILTEFPLCRCTDFYSKLLTTRRVTESSSGWMSWLLTVPTRQLILYTMVLMRQVNGMI